jgi:hypothetical protein
MKALTAYASHNKKRLQRYAAASHSSANQLAIILSGQADR